MTVTEPVAATDETAPGGATTEGGRPPAAARRWLGRRHPLAVELVLVVAIYAAYDAGRGAAGPGAVTAIRHARQFERLERTLHVAVEHPVQQAVAAVPGLVTAFDLSYMSLHLLATGAVLLWLHRRHPRGYVVLRNAVLAASLVSLVCFVVWPTAPPRLAHLGIVDTIARSGIAEGSNTFTLFYNPYAAFPSLHEAYAALAGWGVWRYARHPALRALGVVYPLWVAVEVLATGNHFLVDIVAGTAVSAGALVLAGRLSPCDLADAAGGTRGGSQRSPAKRSSSGTVAPVRSAARTKASVPNSRE